MKSSGQCYYCDHAIEFNNTHVYCNRMKRHTKKLDSCIKYKNRDLNKDIINPPRKIDYDNN